MQDTTKKPAATPSEKINPLMVTLVDVIKQSAPEGVKEFIRISNERLKR
jgi:hypothetical protein